MNEKSLELQNINSPSDNLERQFSFSQNRTQEMNNINTTDYESIYNNGTTNMTIDNNNNLNNSSRRFTHISHNKKYKYKYKLSKLKERTTSIMNFSKKLFGCIMNLIRHLDFLSERKIGVQVGIVYTVLMILLSLGIAYFKAIHIVSIIETISNKNYFSFYVNNIIDSQREIKIQLDELNNHDIISASNDPLLFMKIYTEELVSNKILNKDTIILEENSEKIYSDMGDNYELSQDLYKLADIYKDSSPIEHLDFNIKNMMPFYYHFTPIIVDHLKNCGIQIINFYFVAEGINGCNNTKEGKDTINTMYFKYPLEVLNLGPDTIQKNNKIYDFIIDPYTSCNGDYKGQEDIIDNIKINNWFALSLRDPNLNFRIFKMKKITQEKKRKDYLIFYSRSDNLQYDDKYSTDSEPPEIYFTFSMKVSQSKNNCPFIILDEKDDILNFEYFSIYNFQNNFNRIEEETDTNIKKLFEIDYDIDESQNLLLRIPTFISNMHLYSMEDLESDYYYNENSNYRNREYALLKYKEMVNLTNFYNINYYFQKDSLIFRLIYFLNHFFLFKKNHPEFLTKNYDTLKTTIETKLDHPCIFSDSQEYYDLIKNFYDYDCENDFCFYNNCDQSNNNLKGPDKLYYLPNIYCIPLFCRDTQSINTDFHKNLKDKIKNINKLFSENGYSFTSTYNDYLIKKNYTFSKIDEYFDRNNFIFKTKIKLEQKNNSYNNFFQIKIVMQNLSYQYGDNTFLMFFMNNNMTTYLVYNFKRLNYLFLVYVFGVYVFFVTCSLIILIRYIVFKVDYLTRRIEKIKKIRRTIVSNQVENNSNIEENSNSNLEQNNNFESSTNINEDSNSINSGDSTSNKKKEKKENFEKEKTGEIDELDNLINLVNENVADFQIKFNLTEDMNSIINEIKNQYNGIIKVNQYKNRLLMKSFDNININSFDEEDEISNGSSIDEKEENFDDLSLKMLYELLSTSTSEIDFSNIKTNFYYRENDGKYLFGLEEILPMFNEEDSNGNGEITNLSKIQNAINYYYSNIHSYWKEQYDILKKEENI